MIDFQYEGVLPDGKPCQGSIRAPNEETARLRLIGQGVTPVRIDDTARALSPDVPQGRGARLKRADVLLFSREMAHLKQANMPLDKALAMLKETAETDRLKIFIAKVEESVRGGKSLYQSLLPFEADLGRQYLVLIRAGETSGSLHVVLKELTVQLEADDKLRNYVISSMTYPIILLVVAVLSVVLLLAFVVPQFREIFDSMGDKLPYSTRLVVNMSDAIRGHWMAILLGVTALLFLGSRWAATAGGRLRLDSLLLGFPLFGKVLRNLQFAVYFRTFGILLQRGDRAGDAIRGERAGAGYRLQRLHASGGLPDAEDERPGHGPRRQSGAGRASPSRPATRGCAWLRRAASRRSGRTGPWRYRRAR